MIAADKTVWKVIWSIEGLHSRDKFRYPKTVTDVTLTLIEKSLVILTTQHESAIVITNKVLKAARWRLSECPGFS